ncbi:hypothetical protein EV421DRAFT_1898329 [Armillaria borealis]|uniref:F-box domain-containing protein n=1 Tax=Armillaria borealis TaxID=47425 RepID=A0AA39N0F3_9AGAR|nr:hypothetical protein EV421DRAFT_1898329 [Armillaria borealis]
MDATDAMLHLDAVARSIPEPVLPPNALNSQISGILRATRPFLDTDRDWILQNIEVLEDQLSVYDAFLDRIDQVRSEMQRRRDVVQRSMATHSSALAPIRRLPTEIFRAVFREVQLSLRWNPPGSSFSLTERTALYFSQVPWELSHVCGAWRDIILSYPQLWSSILLDFGTCRPAEELRDIGDSENEDAAIEAFPVILEESYRWRSMELNLSLPLLEQLKAARGKMPFLESLTMEISYERYDPPSIEELPEDVRRVFIDAPCLQRVILPHTRGPSDFMFPLHITHLATFMGNLSNIEAYQSLVECHLAIKEGPGPDFYPPHPIYLPNVRRLLISSPDLFPWLRLPSLDDLTISNGPNFESDMNAVVLMVNEFVYRSRCTLTRLAIHNYVSHDPLFINDCLLLMDSLVSLEIELFWNMKDIFDALASIGFLPNLQHLFLQIRSPQLSSLDLLTAMISSRSQYLRSIRISCDSSDDVERVNEHLAPLRPPGLPMVVLLERRHKYEMIRCFGKFGST